MNRSDPAKSELRRSRKYVSRMTTRANVWFEAARRNAEAFLSKLQSEGLNLVLGEYYEVSQVLKYLGWGPAWDKYYPVIADVCPDLVPSHKGVVYIHRALMALLSTYKQFSKRSVSPETFKVFLINAVKEVFGEGALRIESGGNDAV